MKELTIKIAPLNGMLTCYLSASILINSIVTYATKRLHNILLSKSMLGCMTNRNLINVSTLVVTKLFPR
jgi:hypothetical protein